MTWEELGRGTRELAEMIHADGYVPDMVLAIARGGLLVKDFCAGKVGEVRCAVLYEKPQSEVPCEYVWRRTDRWIDFPWSAQPPVAAPAVPRPDAVL
jgi:hypoxanthine phosphoribosyltransferase